MEDYENIEIDSEVVIDVKKVDSEQDFARIQDFYEDNGKLVLVFK